MKMDNNDKSQKTLALIIIISVNLVLRTKGQPTINASDQNQDPFKYLCDS